MSVSSLNRDSSKHFRIFIAMFLKSILIILILCYECYISYFALSLSDLYDQNMIENGTAVNDLISGFLEDSELYGSNPYLKYLPYVKLTLPLVITFFTGGISEIFSQLGMEEIISLLVSSLANAIVLLPSLRLYDKIAIAFNNKFRINPSFVMLVFDLTVRLIIVYFAAIYSAMFALPIGYFLSPLPPALQIVIVLALMLLVCMVSSLVHVSVFFGFNLFRWIGLFFDFAKTVFVDLLLTILSLFILGSIIIIAQNPDLPSDAVLSLGISIIFSVTAMSFTLKLLRS